MSECLQRELLEELGGEFDSAELICRADEYFKSLVDKETYYLWQGYYHSVVGFRKIGEPTDKTHAVAWLPVNEAKSALRHESQRWALAEVLKHRNRT